MTQKSKRYQKASNAEASIYHVAKVPHKQADDNANVNQEAPSASTRQI